MKRMITASQDTSGLKEIAAQFYHNLQTEDIPVDIRWGSYRIAKYDIVTACESAFQYLGLHLDKKSLKHANNLGNNNEWELQDDIGDTLGYFWLTMDFVGLASCGIANKAHQTIAAWNFRIRNDRVVVIPRN